MWLVQQRVGDEIFGYSASSRLTFFIPFLLLFASMYRYFYSSTKRTCNLCGESWGVLGAALLVCIGLTAFLLRGNIQKVVANCISTFVPEKVKFSRFWGTLKSIDSGTFRCCWSNYQIVESISYVVIAACG